MNAENDEAAVAVTQHVYAAINQAVRTGDFSLLESLVAAEVLDASTDDPSCLRCRIDALHRLAPHVELAIDDVLVDGERVVVRLSLPAGVPPRFLGLPLRGPLAVWGPADVLHIVDGRVVAMEPVGDPTAIIAPEAHLDVDRLPAAPFRLGLIRLTLDPGAAIPEQSQAGRLALLVEKGTLGVVVDRSVSLSRPDPRALGTNASHPAGSITVRRDEQIVLAGDTTYSLHNLGTGPAVVLATAILPGDGGITNRWIRGWTLDEALFIASTVEVSLQTDPPPAWPRGVRSQLLADGLVLARPSVVGRVAVTRVTLPRDISLPMHTVAGGELLVVTAGTAVVDLTSGRGSVRTRAGAALMDLGPDFERVSRDLLISPGGGAVLQPAARAGIRNSGDGRLSLLVVSLEACSGSGACQ